ncbi:MAG: CBS domain-containing protein [Anaerolineales bacterium]
MAPTAGQGRVAPVSRGEESLMHLILTHDQADLDALAALAAMGLLEARSQAVLPRRLNRNVRAFLNLYREELPLVDADELAREKAEAVTLVDTQTLPSVRGIGPGTRVHVIDHHPLHRPLPEGWSAVIDSVGATTTLLVESMREWAGTLTVPQATLLLLGIYEDTGCLTYAGTSPRDIHAAAWLLEHAASLQIAADYLHPPLSAEQRLLFEQLLQATESRELDGLRIVLSVGRAPAGVEEISTLAHKLRDLFDPDALFVLVDLGTHVQLVARSATDQVDVADLMSQFGGGGHRRAAAALIRGKGLEEIRRELLGTLPQYVHPALRVADLYSPMPQVLPPEMRVEEAAERMQRYGYEGFPVVEGQQVVGLLTRRAVDRALAHGMKGASVRSLMEAGSVAVSPADSLARLQRLMAEHGWGQVPVVSEQDGTVIGIVTRTDLLKALTSGGSSRALNVRDRLGQAIPPAHLALLRAVAAAADQRGDSLYLVGGVVRDLLLGIPSFDLDVVVEGDAIGLAQSVAKEYGGRVRGHQRFGTAKWLLDRDRQGLARRLGLPEEGGAPLPPALDLVSARAEFYPRPTSLPEVERGSLKLDLHRRDFTINTLAVSLSGSRWGTLYDYWGGLRDLEERRIRVLHSLSFVDDPTRILRAIRLEQRLGFALEDRTRELIGQALALLHRVSGDRIRHELDSLLEEQFPEKALARLGELQVLEQIDPGLGWPQELAHLFPRVREAKVDASRAGKTGPPKRLLYYGVWFLALGPGAPERILQRLNFPRREREILEQAARAQRSLLDLPGDARPSQVVAALDNLGETAVWLTRVSAGPGPVGPWVGRFLEKWRACQPRSTGEDLQRLGVPAGPRYREILWALRAAWLDGKVSTPQQEQELLERLARGTQ